MDSRRLTLAECLQRLRSFGTEDAVLHCRREDWYYAKICVDNRENVTLTYVIKTTRTTAKIPYTPTIEDLLASDWEILWLGVPHV